MMGMRDLSYWLSWYCYYTCVTTAIVLLAWLVLIINVIDNSNSFLVFLYFLFYAQAVFSQIMFLSSLFNASKYAGIVGTLIYYGFFLLSIPVQSDSASVGETTLFSIFPQVAMAKLTVVFGKLECSGVGLNFDNMSEQIGNYTYLTGMTMLFFDFFAFMLLSIYLDAVLPKTFGEKKKCCFCWTMCSCCKKKEIEPEQEFGAQELQRRSTLQNNGNDQIVTDPFELKNLDPANYEPVAPEVARMELTNECLKISDLTKVYDNGF